MLIYLDPKTYQFLRSYYLKKGNIELELRFGQYKDGKFKPDIGYLTYSKLQNFLSSDKSIITSIEEEDTKVEIYNDNIRKIIFKDGRFLYQRKNKLYTGDIEYKNFVLRLSESDEISITSHIDNKEDIIETRERQRTSYRHRTNAFYYSLTKIITKLQQGPDMPEVVSSETYELEIEYNILPQILPYLTNIIQDSINYILPILLKDSQRNSYLPLSEESFIKDQYNALYIKEPKPVNLTRYITPDLQSMGYSVTNKLDGERFILLFTNMGFYSFNNRKIEKYDGRNYSQSSVPTTFVDRFIYYALDSEFFEGKYYIFDCMVFNGEKVIDMSLRSRIKNAQTVVDTLQIPILTVKKFYEPMIDDIDEKDKESLKKYTQELLQTLPREKNDGIIYTSGGRYNSNVYKWKFPEKMSIDFAVYNIGSNGENKYELYVKDTIEDFPVNVPFHGNNTYELSEAIYESKEVLKEAGIYEFGYDNDTEKFILFRERPDKIDPNYITVAQNVWSDIKNPYTEEELIQLLSPKVLEQYRKYQNNIKRELIETNCQYRNVLDLGSGRGGDLGKYDSANVNYLWCVEPNEKNYTEFLRRLSERKSMKNKTSLIKTVAQDTEKIVKGIRETLVFDNTALFTSKVKFSEEFLGRYPSIRSFTVYDFTSTEALKSVILEILSTEFNINLEKNSFIIEDISTNDPLTDDILFDNFNNELDVIIRSPNIYDEQEVEGVFGVGGDYKKWFPKMKDVDYSKLQITEEGMYSLTKYIDSISIIRAMKNIIGEENLEGLTILDGTANVGGDTIRFAMNFNKVISVELNEDNYKVLSNNVNVYNFQEKVTLINGDITKVYNDLSMFTDVLYLDPPWGGKGYKDFEEEKMVIFLSNLSLTRFIGNVLINPSVPNHIFIKLPVNYNIDSLRNLPYVCDIQVYEIRKFYLVCLTINNKTKPVKKADVLSSFFSLSFFFFRDENGNYRDLDNLVNTIDQTIKEGGIFIGTTIDGTQTKKLLDSKADKKFDFEGGYIRFIDDRNTVELLIRDTIVETQVESLVDFELLEAKLLEKEIYLESSQIFSSSADLTEKENILNSLYRTFVFKKKTKRLEYTQKTTSKLIQKQSKYPLKSPLKSSEIINVLSLTSLTSPTSEHKKCINYAEDLIEIKKTLENYSFVDFQYIPDRTRLIISKQYKNPTNIFKEYCNSILLKENDIIDNLDTEGFLGNSVVLNMGKKTSIIGSIDKLFEYDINTIVSCLYQLYNIMLNTSAYDINLSNPIMFLSKNNMIEKRHAEDPIYTKVFDGIIANVLNYSYTQNLSPRKFIFPQYSEMSFNLIEILQYFDNSYKKSLYYSLFNISNRNEFIDFIKEFIDIKKAYLDFSSYNKKVQVSSGTIQGYNDHNDLNNIQSFYLKHILFYTQNEIDGLSDSNFEYYSKIQKILNRTSIPKKTTSNKVYKWLEVLSLTSLDTSQNYTVFSNGYMPQMFLYALKSYLKTYDTFTWYANTYNRDEDIDINKCRNTYNLETSNFTNIYNIHKKTKGSSIDIYASYFNKNFNDDKHFLGDILLGLYLLKEGGTMIFNVKSFLGDIELHILSFLVELFEGKIDIYKPYSSVVTDSEVYIVCQNYKRDNDKIELLKTVLSENSINPIKELMTAKKYSGFLFAAYLYYGRQIYFMEKDMELYKRLSKLYDISEISKKKIEQCNDKFVNYYYRKRRELTKLIDSVENSFVIKKWDNHKCKSRKIKIASKEQVDEEEEEEEEEENDVPKSKKKSTINIFIHRSMKGIHKPIVLKNTKISTIEQLYDNIKGNFQQDILLYNYDKCCKGKQPPDLNDSFILTQNDINNTKDLNLYAVPISSSLFSTSLSMPKSSMYLYPLDLNGNKPPSYFKLNKTIPYYEAYDKSPIKIIGFFPKNHYVYYVTQGGSLKGLHNKPHPSDPSRTFDNLLIYDSELNNWSKIVYVEKGWKDHIIDSSFNEEDEEQDGEEQDDDEEKDDEEKDNEEDEDEEEVEEEDYEKNPKINTSNLFPPKKMIEVIGTVFKKKGTEGDFEWQIKSNLYDNSLFLFNDDEYRNKWKKAGQGNAIIRKYNKYAMPTRPRSVGIVTGKDEKGYDKLTPEVKKAIDKTIEEAREIINKYSYKKVYYSASTPNGILGTSIFKVGDNVLKYITDQIKTLENISLKSWGSENSEEIF